MIDRNDMPMLRTKLCELAERVARGFGVTLDYSERSVRDVERILGEIHAEYRRTKSEEGLQGLALEFGAYLVSVLEKHRGPVVWKRDHPDFGEDAFPLEWRGATLFPVGWCLKRIIDGPGDDVVSKWKALVVNRDGESTADGCWSGMCHGCLAILGLLSMLTGCTSPAFKLSDKSAVDRLLATRHVVELQRRNPTPLSCWVEGTEPNARRLYLGENHPDHTVRVGAYRVTADGRAWVNADPTLLEERWTVVE